MPYVVEDESGILDLFLLILLVVDGFGQFYNGEYRKGVKFLAWGLLSVVFVSVDGLMGPSALSWPACYILAARDAYRSAKVWYEESLMNRLGWFLGAILVIILTVARIISG